MSDNQQERASSLEEDEDQDRRSCQKSKKKMSLRDEDDRPPCSSSSSSEDHGRQASGDGGGAAVESSAATATTSPSRETGSKQDDHDQAAVAEEAGGISCLELDAWIRDDDAMDCMMLLPEMAPEGDSPDEPPESMHEDDCCEQLEQQQHHQDQNHRHEECQSMIFCNRSSSNCSSTFPDSSNQETLELSLPDDFFDEQKQQQQILGEEARDSSADHQPQQQQQRFLPDLKKIIVKKPVMDKAVERLGGGRRGAMRLWNIIQVWLRYQQQQQGGGSHSQNHNPCSSFDGLMLPFESFAGGAGGAGFVDMNHLNVNVDQNQHHHQQNQSFVPDSQHFFDASSIHQQQQQPQFCSYADLASSAGTPISGPISPHGSSSAAAASTRAARKSRMARQRRHRNGNHSTNNSSNNSNMNIGSSTFNLASDGVSAAVPQQGVTAPSWSSSSSPATSIAAAPVREQQMQRFATCREGKARMNNNSGCDKSVKFLLQKELKPSDVGNLGRIVLPKKEAEIHLPYLSLREGITLVMEDMLSTHTWHFRYRFWPNNKSRMYLLEGTGDYVKCHQLKEGDLLQIYRDCKSGKHMIYGKKIVKSIKANSNTNNNSTTTNASKLPEDDCLSGASTVSDSSKDAEQHGGAGHEIDRFPSIDMGDEFIEEILGLVDAEEPSSPESCKEDN